MRGARIDYFGAGRQLLGALHQPQRLRPRSTAVLLCNPFGEEASRSHRIYRVLATQLERAGFTAMRFDYSGTGDSQGDSAEVGVDDWLHDIDRAAERLRAVSGATRVAIVGLRFGATLAALASQRGLAVRHLLLWDPVVEGAIYLKELIAQHRNYMRAEIGEAWTDRLRVSAAGIPDEALGAPIGGALGGQIAAIDLASFATLAADHLTVITTRMPPDVERLRARLGSAARWIEMKESPAWNSDAALNAMTVPMDIVQALIARIEEISPS